jgi:cell division protein FtsZ
VVGGLARLTDTHPVDPSAQTFTQLVIVVLAGLLVVRILIALPGWIRRGRRPEARAILVVGVGGGGGNAVDRMVDAGIPGVGFVVCNTDAQALRRSLAPTKIRIGDAITHGLGSGGDPTVGRRAAEEDADRIARAVSGADLVFVTAGLGGGTGSGAAPLVAAKAKEQGALTIAVVTKPFDFEGTRRKQIADEAAANLLTQVDALITVPNDRVSEVVREDASALDAFRSVNDVLLQAVQGIVDLLTAPGLINLDFADVRAVMHDAGPALVGLGRGSGEDRAVEAARAAISSPLLEASIEGARGILFQVSGPADLRLQEVRLVADVIRANADPEANVIFGASIDDRDDGQVMVTLIATGLVGPRGTSTRSVAPASVPRPARSSTERVDPPGESPVEPEEELEPAEPPKVTAKPRPAEAATVADDDLELPTFLRGSG